MRLTTARVHFQMRIFPQTVDTDEPTFPQPRAFQCLAFFRPSVTP